METLRLCNFCNFGATLLGFGTVFTNIILLWIRNFEKNRTTPTPQKNQKPPKTLRIYMNLWKLCDYITFVDLELDVWNLVQCLLISFCLGSENLVQLGLPQPPKNTPKPPKHSEYELMETLRLYNFCRFGPRGLGFSTVFTNIILLWIRNFE